MHVILLYTATMKVVIGFAPLDKIAWRPPSILRVLVEDDDANFYRDLQKAKNKRLGSPIPKKQLEETAQGAEGDFLRAMKESRKEFQDAKEEFGSEGAVDFFLERIREEDERQENETED